MTITHYDEQSRAAFEALRAENNRLREALKSKIDYHMNEYLCGMKPDHDDSIYGFNEAWKIVDKVFKEAGQ